VSFTDPSNIKKALPSSVLIGAWDPGTNSVVYAGSGYIVDGKRGLVVTAAHVLFNFDRSKGPFGAKHGERAVVGIIPDRGGCSAVFRYFAEIVAEEIHQVDACVLRIVSRMEEDIDHKEDFAAIKQRERPFDSITIQREGLRSLKMAKRCELGEHVRIVGYNQGGEGRLEKGKHISHAVEFVQGYVCRLFDATIRDGSLVSTSSSGSTTVTSTTTTDTSLDSAGFSPRKEIVVNTFCCTIPGQSGGVAVNGRNEVVGILSRADPADPYRAYLVPFFEYLPLVRRAKKICDAKTN